MAAITWRSLMGQNPDPVRAMAAAQDSFNGMFGSLNKALETRNNSMEEASKQGFLNELYGAQSVEGFDQSRDALTGKLQGLSAENQAAVRPLLEQRRAQLMQSSLAEQQYKDVQETRGQQDVVNGLQEALLRASTPEEAKNIQQAISIYQANNMLNTQGGAALMKDALSRGTDLDNQSWTNKEREQKELDWNHLAKKRPLELDQMSAQTEATRRQGKGNSEGLAAIGPLMKLIEGVADNSTAPAKAEVDGSIFSGPLAIDAKGRDASSKLLDTTGVSVWNMLTDKNTFVDNVIKSGSTGNNPVLTPDGKNILFRNAKGEAIEMPFSQQLMESIIRQDNGSVTDPSVGDVVGNLRKLANQPHVMEAAERFMSSKETINMTAEQKAKAFATLLQGRFGEAEKKR